MNDKLLQIILAFAMIVTFSNGTASLFSISLQSHCQKIFDWGLHVCAGDLTSWKCTLNFQHSICKLWFTLQTN